MNLIFVIGFGSIHSIKRRKSVKLSSQTSRVYNVLDSGTAASYTQLSLSQQKYESPEASGYVVHTDDQANQALPGITIVGRECPNGNTTTTPKTHICSCRSSTSLATYSHTGNTHSRATKIQHEPASDDTLLRGKKNKRHSGTSGENKYQEANLLSDVNMTKDYKLGDQHSVSSGEDSFQRETSVKTLASNV